jgi:phage tail-like protein
MAKQQLFYPPAGFNFSVSFALSSATITKASIQAMASQLVSTSADNGFAKVSGIGMNRQTEDIMEGGTNNRRYRLPTAITYDNLVLERGFAYRDSGLGAWCYNALTLPSGKLETRQVVVHLLPNAEDRSAPLMSWAFYDCYPLKWKLSDLNAKESVLAIETLELAYSYFSPIT